MKKILASFVLLFSAVSYGDTIQGGEQGALSQTPQNPFTHIGKVNSFKVRVIPGYCSKVYVGFSNMNITTLQGVIKVLYPNCNGGLSDEWKIEDVAHTGTDVFDPSIIYLAADQYGTAVTWEANTVGVAASQYLKPFGLQGPIDDQIVYGVNASAVEAHVIPGMAGKINISIQSTCCGPFSILYPNNGVVTGNITDQWTYGAILKNGLKTKLVNVAEIPGEYALITQWQYQ